MKLLRFATLLGACALAPSFAFAAPVTNVASVPKSSFRDLGPASTTTPVSIAVTLEYHNINQLEQLVTLQSDEGSPYYRHWLTSAQFDAAFAPTAAEYAKVAASLRRAGFRITKVYSNRTVIDGTGSVATAERFFSTKIDRVAQPGYGVRFANVTPARVPPDLQGLVFSVAGLHDLALVHTHFMPVERGVAVPAFARYTKSKNPVLFGPPNPVDDVAGYSPLALTDAYDFPVSHNASYNGKGSTAGIVIDADFWDTDLTNFLAYFKIKHSASVTRVAIDGGPGSPSSGDQDTVEATLDVESLVGTSPGASLYVYETPNFLNVPLTAVTDAYNQVVSDNKVDSVNSSFGACEDSDLNTSETWDRLAMQGAALGITFHAATGDEGVYGCENASASLVEGTEIPASSGHVVAVGGTTLAIDANGSYAGEEGWDSNGGASGGGISDVFLLPSWQAGVKNIVRLGRNLPDVAFDADPFTGFALYYDGSWTTKYNPTGGTSLASPLFGSAVAQMVQVTGGRLGLAGAKLFKLWKADGYTKNGTTYFHDVLFGSNGYAAAKGYDLVTGIGSLDVWNVTQALK
jgi:subtilase family serine protease